MATRVPDLELTFGRFVFIDAMSPPAAEGNHPTPEPAWMREKSEIAYLFMAGSINLPSISKSIFKRLTASLAVLRSLKGPAITR